MGLNNMMYNGISGINSMSSNMGVLGANIANVNTVSYKTVQSTFYNVLTSSQERFGETGNGSQMGPVGSAVQVSRNFQQGQLEGTSQSTDMAVSGKGFFLINDHLSGETLYTRDGQFNPMLLDFTPDGFYHLVTPAGYTLQGLTMDNGEVNGDTVEDILARRQSQPKATESISLALNLRHNPDGGGSGLEGDGLHALWDGTQSPPLAATAYEYKTALPAYDDQGQRFDLNAFFRQTADPQVQEFILGHDPALDRRLLGEDGSRYGDDSELAGAGALLYGRLIFNTSGELVDMEAWQVPPDGGLEPGPQNMLAADPDSGLYSFAYNISGIGENLSSTIDFGMVFSRQTTTSLGAAKATGAGEGAPAIDPLTSWQQVYDARGNRVGDGDRLFFSGRNAAGEEVELEYTVDYAKRVDDLLAELEDEFDCVAVLKNGLLSMEAREPGENGLMISAVTYRDGEGNTPAENPALAQIFGEQGSSFTLRAGGESEWSPLRTTNYTTASTTLHQAQDGYAKGFLENISVQLDGTIMGNYSNGQSQAQARVVLADFTSYQGLIAGSHNTFRAGADVGQVIIRSAAEGSFGQVVGNSLEVSNVDLARQFVDLTMTQRIFQANSKAITTADEVYQTLLRMK